MFCNGRGPGRSVRSRSGKVEVGGQQGRTVICRRAGFFLVLFGVGLPAHRALGAPSEAHAMFGEIQSVRTSEHVFFWKRNRDMNMLETSSWLRGGWKSIPRTRAAAQLHCPSGTLDHVSKGCDAHAVSVVAESSLTQPLLFPGPGGRRMERKTIDVAH